MMNKFDLPPIWLAIHFAMAYVLSLLAPWPELSSGGWSILGLALWFAGGSIIIWTAAELRKYNTTIHPTHRSKHVVQTGPFARSRHPIYLAMIMMLLGFVLMLGSALAVLVLPSFFLVVRRFALREEHRLREAFSDYDRYAAKTQRWI